MPDHHILTDILEQVGCGVFNSIATGQIFNSFPADEISNLDVDRKDYCNIPGSVLIERKDPEPLVKNIYSHVHITTTVVNINAELTVGEAVVHTATLIWGKK
jgi:hypothetical protein